MAYSEQAVICVDGRINGCGIRFVNLLGKDVHFHLNNILYIVKAELPGLDPEDDPPKEQDWVRCIVPPDIAYRYQKRRDFYVPKCVILDEMGGIKYYSEITSWKVEINSSSDDE